MLLFSGRAGKVKYFNAIRTHLVQSRDSLRINLVVLAMAFQEDVLHLLFGPNTNLIKDDEGDSIDPFLTDEPKAGPPVATDVEWAFNKKFITCKFNSYIYEIRI
jgi:hypothetical protein